MARRAVDVFCKWIADHTSLEYDRELHFFTRPTCYKFVLNEVVLVLENAANGSSTSTG